MSEHPDRLGPQSWPIDSDVAADDLAPTDVHRTGIDPDRLLAVIGGGFVGGLARYEIAQHWATKADGFPWPIFVVNTVGAFVLGVVVIVVLEVLAGSRYLRPLLGAGFCGALTTFSSVAVTVDQLLRHGHAAMGVGYLAGSLAAGLAAAALGAALGRAIPQTARRTEGAVS